MLVILPANRLTQVCRVACPVQELSCQIIGCCTSCEHRLALKLLRAHATTISLTQQKLQLLP